jgi:hypothetical protein
VNPGYLTGATGRRTRHCGTCTPPLGPEGADHATEQLRSPPRDLASGGSPQSFYALTRLELMDLLAAAEGVLAATGAKAAPCLAS